MKKLYLWIMVLTILAAGCSPTPQSGNPKWVDELINKYENQPVGNPPRSIWRYEYAGQTVYFMPAQCCDQYSALYDTNGDVLCAPDGGFTGGGDGKCTDFFSKRTDETLIWLDSRSR